ncbi:MAG: hypothetical protein RL204_1284 [Bacteroidota bacterium]|jgi:hypothetical protein
MSSIGQSNNAILLPLHNLELVYWQDSAINKQIEYWPNGLIKIEYEPIKDSLRLRRDYYESGNLKSSAEVFQQFSEFILYKEYLESGEKVPVSWSGYTDVLNGLYLEYKNQFGTAPVEAKTFYDGRYTGEFIYSNSCCNCPFIPGRTDTTLSLLNEKTIFLCGYPIEVGKEKFFSQFTLGLCGQEPISGHWDDKSLCKINTQSDTLFVEETISLPIGEKMEYLKTNWSVEKFHYENKELIQSISINRNIRKYSKKEINQTIKLYENSDLNGDSDILDIMNKLFIATISGDLQCREYFKNLPTKFNKLDGENLQAYQILQEKLVLWDSVM